MPQKFSVTNYKGIHGTVEVSTDGGSIVVQGNNAAGKSSFIDAITELFDARGVRLTPMPIHEGEDHAKAEFTDDALDIRIVREWERKDDGSITQSLSVYSLDGAMHGRPAELIRNLLGGVIFDPVKFLQLDPKPQRDALLQKVKFTDPTFDLDQIDREQAAAEEERTKAFQVKQAAIGAVTNAEKPAPGTPAEPVSTRELVAELTAAQEFNAQRAEVADLIETARVQTEALRERIASLEQQLAAARADLATQETALADRQKRLAELGPEVDLAPIQARIDNVDEINRNVQLAQQLKRLEAEKEQKIAAHAEAEELVQSYTQRKKDALSTAIFPDPHLSVDDGQVLYDGVPFSQANTASRSRAAFAIATSGDSDLRLVIIKDGDLLDEESLAAVDALARERGFTTLIERGRPDVGGLVATFVEMRDGQAA